MSQLERSLQVKQETLGTIEGNTRVLGVRVEENRHQGDLGEQEIVELWCW